MQTKIFDYYTELSTIVVRTFTTKARINNNWKITTRVSAPISRDICINLKMENISPLAAIMDIFIYIYL